MTEKEDRRLAAMTQRLKPEGGERSSEHAAAEPPRRKVSGPSNERVKRLPQSYVVHHEVLEAHLNEQRRLNYTMGGIKQYHYIEAIMLYALDHKDDVEAIVRERKNLA